MPSGQAIGALTVIGSGQTWIVISTDSGGAPVYIAGPFDTQKGAQKYIATPF
jgi:hypothetical protein